MKFRTVVITNKSKLNYKNRFLVVKRENDEKLIHLSEIDTILVDTLNVSISSYLLKELADNKINIIFCDDKHNPFGELCTYYANYNTSKKIKEQIAWDQYTKDLIWQNIVKNKIKNQSLLLSKIKSSKCELLLSYIKDVTPGDKNNREGHAAKVYFNALFGNSFSRDKDIVENAALNYGYSILLSTINKEIVSSGYLTQLGIHHKNEFNQFNLACDLMEPFRIIIDNYVFFNRTKKFDINYKLSLVNILNNIYKYQGKKYLLKEIIKLYVNNTLSIFDKTEYEEFLFYEE